MNTTQIQIKLSLSEQLNELLKSKAARLGVPVTQFVKHLIMQEVKDEEYPTYQMSERTERLIKKAMKERDKAIEVTDIHKFFREL